MKQKINVSNDLQPKPFRHKIKRYRVHAKPFMRWRRTVIKYMPQMRIAAGTDHLGALHAI